MRHEAQLSEHAEAVLLAAIDEGRRGDDVAWKRALAILKPALLHLVGTILPRWWERKYAEKSTNFLRICDVCHAVIDSFEGKGRDALRSWDPKRGDLANFLSIVVRQAIVTRATTRVRGLRAQRNCEGLLITNEETDLVKCAVEVLLPWIRHEVKSALANWARTDARCPEQEVRDLCHEVCLRLLRKEGYLLIKWEATRGYLLPYVRMVANQTVSKTVKGKRTPWLRIPADIVDHFHSGVVEDYAGILHSSHDMEIVLAHLRKEVRPTAYLVFYGLFIEGLRVDEVCEIFGMKASAVYASKSRTLKAARNIARRLCL